MFWPVDRSTLIRKNVPNEYHTKNGRKLVFSFDTNAQHTILLRSNAFFPNV